MESFVKLLRMYDDFFAIGGADTAAVLAAEDALSLTFAKEYKQYLEDCGVASADGHEFTGIVNSPRLNVVDVTVRAKKKNANIPENLYVIEEVQIDGIVIWQAGNGKVYKSVGNGIPEEICSSIVDYLQEECG